VDPARTTATPLDLSGTASDTLGDGSLVDVVKVVWDN
jgi:hypothetical protein